MSHTPTNPIVSTVDVRGGSVHVEVRGQGPAVLLFGCPMDARSFVPLAEDLAADHTVITTDPRGFHRSTVEDRDLDVSPETLAADLGEILVGLDVGPVALFGSSGGAVAALALVVAHPELVHTVIAHEPPLEELLDDRDRLRAHTERMVQAHLAGDIDGAWQMFFDGADIVPSPTSPTSPTDDASQVEPDPQAVLDEHFFFAHTLRPTTWWQPDLAALRAAPTHLVIGVGEASTGQVCDRTSAALATALGRERAVFPGDHTGFVDLKESFAARLRGVLGRPPDDRQDTRP